LLFGSPWHAFEHFPQRRIVASLKKGFFYSYTYIAKEMLLLIAEVNQGKSKF
jgi:hypothetical protein